jgi:putative ABC transport system permease protein
MTARRMLRLALQMLLGDRAKCIGILVGVTFASLLITQQAAIFDGLMARSHGAIDDVGGIDLWVMDPKVQQVDDYKPMTDTALGRVRSVAGVAWAVPLYRGQIKARLADGTQQACLIMGLDDASLTARPPVMVQGRVEDLRRADAVIVEEHGAGEALAHPPGPDGTRRPLSVGDVIELNDRRRVVVGICRTTRSFMWFPTIYTTYSRALEMAPPERRSLTFVLAKVVPGAAPEAVAERILAATGMVAVTPDAFRRRTVDYVQTNTGIPINFMISMTLGFIIGAIIVGQTFFNFVHDHLRHLGTFKAMGTRNRTLAAMVLAQVGSMAVIGYGLGIGLAALFGWAVAGSELAFRLELWRLGFTAAAVGAISLLAALLALRQVLRLEPAMVFRA